MHAKQWTSSLKSVLILALCRYTKTAQRIFNCDDILYASLTPVKILNSLIYRTLFYVNIYGGYELPKTVQFFGPPCICIFCLFLYLYCLKWRIKMNILYTASFASVLCTRDPMSMTSGRFYLRLTTNDKWFSTSLDVNAVVVIRCLMMPEME